MPETLTLPTYLKQRAKRNFAYLLREAEAVSPAEALRFVTDKWETHRWGIGQNGSIAGIVYHVAAWKSLSLSLFEAEPRMQATEDFDPTAAPSPNDWEGVLHWLREVGEQWITELERLEPADFERLCPWDTKPIPLWEFVTEFIEHDVQHAAQIEYLRQRLLAEKI